MKDVILSTEKLCKTFSNGGMQQHVLENLDIEIYKGDFTVIMGSSGAGKSTLLYALSGMDKPTLGSHQISWAGDCRSVKRQAGRFSPGKLRIRVSADVSA